MKAHVITGHGGLDVFQYMDVPTPEIGAQDVLVRVEACALNRLDIWTRQGIPGLKIPLPHILGSDICGVVEALGPEAAGLKLGQRVALSPGIDPQAWPAPTVAERNYSPSFAIRGLQLPGGYAEFAVAHVSDVIPVSDAWSPEQWAAVPLTFLTAWHMLVSRARVQPGETVLIQGGGSGLGVAAIQIAKLFQCKVITTAGTDIKCAKTRSLGADVAVNYRKASFADVVMDVTGGRGADVIFEHVGPAVWDGCLACLGRRGRLVTCGMTTGREVKLDLRPVYTRQQTIMGCYMGEKPELVEVLRWVEKGVLKPVVDKTYPLRRAPEAQKRMMDGKHVGKIVLQIGSFRERAKALKGEKKRWKKSSLSAAAPRG